MITQLQLINYILSSHDFSVISNNNLSIDYFPNFKNEFNFISNHYKNYGNVPDITTFLNSFPEFEVLQIKESTDYLVSELYKENNENYLVKAFNKVKELLLSGKTEEALEYYTKSSQNVSTNKRMDAVNILQDISRYDSYLDRCNNFNKYYIPTGFKELDDSLGGGIDRQNAYFVISARPGIGKTLIMIKFAAESVKAGLRVGFYEGEMTVDKIAGRYDTLVSHISNGNISHGNISISNNYKKYLDNLKSGSGALYILTRDMMDSDRVTVNTLESFVDKYNLDILFIDQISLLDPPNRFGKSYEQVADISKEIKKLQVRKHIPIVVASQQNRLAVEEGKVAGTENLAGADRIGQDASEVICLSKKDNTLQIDIAKARDGAKKYTLKYEVDFDKGRFDYIPDGDESDTNEEYQESYRPANNNLDGEVCF